jgi:hypothetical protein
MRNIYYILFRITARKTSQEIGSIVLAQDRVHLADYHEHGAEVSDFKKASSFLFLKPYFIQLKGHN